MPAAANSVILTSPRTRDDCISRLNAAIDSPWVLIAKHPVVGEVNGDTFHGRRSIAYRNSFQTRVTAKLTGEEGHTRIACSFGEMPMIGIIVIAGLAAAIIASVSVSTIFLLRARGVDVAPYLPAILAIAIGAIPVMALFALAVTRIGRWLAKGDRAFLIDFLVKTLDARTAT